MPFNSILKSDQIRSQFAMAEIQAKGSAGSQILQGLKSGQEFVQGIQQSMLQNEQMAMEQESHEQDMANGELEHGINELKMQEAFQRLDMTERIHQVKTAASMRERQELETEDLRTRVEANKERTKTSKHRRENPLSKEAIANALKGKLPVKGHQADKYGFRPTYILGIDGPKEPDATEIAEQRREFYEQENERRKQMGYQASQAADEYKSMVSGIQQTAPKSLIDEMNPNWRAQWKTGPRQKGETDEAYQERLRTLGQIEQLRRMEQAKREESASFYSPVGGYGQGQQPPMQARPLGQQGPRQPAPQQQGLPQGFQPAPVRGPMQGAAPRPGPGWQEPQHVGQPKKQAQARQPSTRKQRWSVTAESGRDQPRLFLQGPPDYTTEEAATVLQEIRNNQKVDRMLEQYAGDIDHRLVVSFVKDLMRRAERQQYEQLRKGNLPDAAQRARPKMGTELKKYTKGFARLFERDPKRMLEYLEQYSIQVGSSPHTGSGQ